MKKLLLGFILGVGLTSTTAVFAENGLEKITAYLKNDMPIKLDGKQIELDNAPIVYDGTTYLPLRELATVIGKEVKWNPQSRSVEMSSTAGAEGGSTMSSQSSDTAAVPVSEVTYEDLSAVKVGEVTYFSPTDYNRKHPDSGAFSVDTASGKLTVKKQDGTILELSINDPDVIVIYKGQSYINVQYYP